MPVRGSNNALWGFCTFNAKDLLKASSLHFLSSLLEQLLPLGLSSSFLLKNLHELHVELVSSSHDNLFSLWFWHLATLAWIRSNFSLWLIGLGHKLRDSLNFWRPLWHETAAGLSSMNFTWLVVEFLIYVLLLRLWRSDLACGLRFIKLLNGGVALVLLTGTLALHAWLSLSISVAATLNGRARYHLIEFFFGDSELR